MYKHHASRNNAFFVIVLVVLSAIVVVSASTRPASDPSRLFAVNSQQVDSDFAETRMNRERASKTSVELLTDGALKCRLNRSCTAFKDTLLVLKLNPVRLLWLDALLRFYSLGFPHIAVYAPLEKPRDSEREAPRGNSPINTNSDFLFVGQHDMPVRLIDDNYGFCDHETVADAMRRFHHDFDGFLYLSDDVMLEFWRLVDLDRKRSWRQQPTKSNLSPNEKHSHAWEQVLREFPDIQAVLNPAKPPFAATSGVYYVPTPRNTVVGNSTRQRFMRISNILLRHRTYNEFGTPFLLQACDRGSYVRLNGKLAWGTKRHFAVSLPQTSFVWLHPVRVSGELFARIAWKVWELSSSNGNNKNIDPEFAIDSSIFYEKCMNCATHVEKDRRMKMLLHSCAASRDTSLCANKEGDANPEASAMTVRSLWPIMSGPHVAKLLAGRVVVPPERREVPCALELAHEGFWNAETVDAVFRGEYPRVNNSQRRLRSAAWLPFPDCCKV